MRSIVEGQLVVDKGIVYRNPKPHVRSIHAYFPSVVDLGSGEMLCSMVLGSAFESADSRIYLARSQDGGVTWNLEGRMLPEPASDSYSESCRIAKCSNGSLIAVVFRWDRHRQDEGLANPENLGFAETTIYLSHSHDGGRKWSGLKPVAPPLVGPEFELTSPMVELSDGRWLLPTGTCKSWNGYNPSGMKAVAFVSYDQGDTWPEYVDVMDNTKDNIIYWEQKIVELDPSRLLSVAWAYDAANGKDLRNTYSISEDGGRTFSPANYTDLHGQTPSLLPLGGDEVLCVYRRTDIPGLWAATASLAGGVWKTREQAPLWRASGVTTGKLSENAVENFNTLRFGAPTVIRLHDGGIFAAFWSMEDCVSNVRWLRWSI